jgi:hypothetical protein
MTKQRRWLASVIAASAEVQVALPWQRGARRRPAALRTSAGPCAPSRSQARPAVRGAAIAAH